MLNSWERSTTTEGDWNYFHYVLSLNLKYVIDEKSSSGITFTKEDGAEKGKEHLLKQSCELEIELWQHQLKMEIEAQFELLEFDKIVEGVLGKKKGSFPLAFKAIQGTAKGRLGTVFGRPVEFAAGLETSKEPVVVKLSCEIKSKFGKATIEGELHLGLSAEGWRALAVRVSKSTLVNFLQEQGYAGVLRYLVSAGVIEIAGAAVGTMALVALAAAVTQTQQRNGKLSGIETAYYGGYLRTIFVNVNGLWMWRRPPLLTKEELQLWTVFENAGRNDANRHARMVLARLGVRYNPNDAEEPALRLMLLLTKTFGSREKAYEEVNRTLHESASPIFGRSGLRGR